MRFVCPVCGREEAEDEPIFGEAVAGDDSGEVVMLPCSACIERSFRSGFGIALCEALWTARQRGWPKLVGGSQREADHAYVLRDAEVRELEWRLQGLAMTPEIREQTVNDFVHDHTETSWWLTTECPAAEVLERLCT